MVCLYGTLAPFGDGKAFTLMVLQAARMRAAASHSRRASICFEALSGSLSSRFVCISYASRGGKLCQSWPQRAPFGIVRFPRM